MFGILDWICIGVIVTIILVIVVAILAWKYFAPDRPGLGSQNPYAGTGPPLAPGTHRSHIPAQGIDAGVGPHPSPTTPPCPNCGRPGTFDAAKHNYYCPSCKRWF